MLDRLVEDLASTPLAHRLIVLSDSGVAPLHAEPVLRALIARGLRADLVVFSAGETSKTRATKAAVEDRMAELGVGRDAALVAIGGGVTGDLGGFVAATWHRGIPVIHVPTTVLAMADAALGGKTAVDLPAGKNLVGAFHHPVGVYADIGVLSTLTDEAYRSGFSEVLKSAVVASAGLFRWLETHHGPLLSRDPQALEHALASCLDIKARIVRRDPRETGRRAALNFGHTVGHAIEAVTGYTTPHGEAIALGMVAEASLAAGCTGFPAAHVDRLVRVLEKLRLPTYWPPTLAVEEVARATRADKKAREGRVRYALPARIGRMPEAPAWTVAVDEGILVGTLQDLVRRGTGFDTGPLAD